MENKFFRNVLFLSAFVIINVAKAQRINPINVTKIEIIATALNCKNELYSASEKDIREMKEKGQCFYRVIKSQSIIAKVLTPIDNLIACNGFKGIIYPKIIIDIFFENGHNEKIIISSLQNISINERFINKIPLYLKPY